MVKTIKLPNPDIPPEVIILLKEDEEFHCPFCNSNEIKTVFYVAGKKAHPYPSYCNKCENFFKIQIKGKPIIEL